MGLVSRVIKGQSIIQNGEIDIRKNKLGFYILSMNGIDNVIFFFNLFKALSEDLHDSSCAIWEHHCQ